jgi:hypothetical protein
MLIQRLFVGFVVWCAALWQQQAFGAADWQATGQQVVVVAGGSDAVDAGMGVLRRVAMRWIPRSRRFWRLASLTHRSLLRRRSADSGLRCQATSD